ncbi:gene transfer agent family protein [Phaeobacter sp. B1627]|uniref:gene transfer agent family protein n=1 Tax=Phaeobacter sp. B1627 TaxID=2583809 RepID=UPI00111BB9A8|nr:gene transfer agent family protein [Phaeobacter sp. B1627]TNJ46726.1 gene transfer agent family protein [Phaeobacter sp. B1627]
MANPLAGEVALVVDGQRHILKLTLGALAELEAELGEGDLISLVQRFETGRFSSGDLLALLAAGMRGGGAEMSRQTLATAGIDGGVMQAASVAAQLLALSFAAPVAP